ncbi:hypothetical protein K443DRAFT_599845 [Laccaria amethystina LaAM-08-1]|uniref:Uncharacterized protein n=1 Tax=Laccaria amethystina LaAM-08-1 TaxID=1095629 RepID=A0A0C9X6E0_9AGAR|nr:hypothetical protein K443DRAFT_599845 [Laccaria amethystina LaAM-08-1]
MSAYDNPFNAESPSSDSYSPPQPHPYQLAAYNSSPVESRSPVISYHSRPLEPDKPSESITASGHTFTVTQQQQQPQLSLPQFHHLSNNPLTLFFIFLPIPPLLSLLYIVTGHAILQHHHKSNGPYSAPFSSSAKAGLVGGTILSIPIALLLYLILLPTSKPDLPEDFFEDDEVEVGKSRWVWYAGLVTVIILVLCIGGAAGPLGVTCLSIEELLSLGEAAAAGIVGGLVLAVGSATVAAVGLACFAIWLRRNSRS